MQNEAQKYKTLISLCLKLGENKKDAIFAMTIWAKKLYDMCVGKLDIKPIGIIAYIL